MPSFPLTEEAKALAVELDRRIKTKKLTRDLHYIVDRDRELIPHNETTENNKDLDVDAGGPLAYSELSELVDAGLIRKEFVSGSVWSFRVLQALHEAVATDFGESRPSVLGIQSVRFEVKKDAEIQVLDDINYRADKTVISPTNTKWKKAIIVIAFIIGSVLIPLIAALLSNSEIFPIRTQIPATRSGTELPATDIVVDSVLTNRPPVLVNASWNIVENSHDDVVMVLVPAGCFMMGVNEGPQNEQPAHQTCLNRPFWIDKFEVTQSQFERLGGEKNLANKYTGDQLPVEQITWYEATNFCEKRGGRLPTEAEWEYTARGPQSWIYPWGNKFIDENIIYGENSDGATAPVGTRANASWVGAFDMSGNVWEWTASVFTDNYQDWVEPPGNVRDLDTVNDTDDIVLRGGGAEALEAFEHTSTRRIHYTPSAAPTNVGFRCVKDY